MNSMGNQGYPVPDEAPKVPRGGWTDHIFGPAIKQILCSAIGEPNPDTIKDTLRDPDTQDYVFSCKGDFYFCNCLSDGTFLVLEPKGTGETDGRRYIKGAPKGSVSGRMTGIAHVHRISDSVNLVT
ncbi:hypothetical protein BDR07DRAFT_1459274 [Suillus spraguei]|nr:hypothetical protein BDR07DRAFT_1459274 [Suillus spraguei]